MLTYIGGETKERDARSARQGTSKSPSNSDRSRNKSVETPCNERERGRRHLKIRGRVDARDGNNIGRRVDVQDGGLRTERPRPSPQMAGARDEILTVANKNRLELPLHRPLSADHPICFLHLVQSNFINIHSSILGLWLSLASVFRPAASSRECN